MRCVMCGRPMNRPALQLGKMALGPKCARRAGLIQPKAPRQAAEPVYRDALTRDLFEVAHG